MSRPLRAAAGARHLWIAAGALAVLGVLLLARIVAGIPSMGGDNAGYLVLARSLLEGEGYRDLYLPGAPLHTKYPPLYPLLLAGAMAAGAVTWLHYILVSAALVLASSLLVLLWAAERRGVAFGFGVALLALLSPAFLSAATEILSEPLFLLLTFLALWAAGRPDGAAGPAERGPKAPDPDPDDRNGPGSGRSPTPWLVLAGTAAILTWWTRSAGLPLVLAVAGVLLLRRRWKSLGLYGAAFLLPALAWTWRGRGARTEADGYLSEFWMVNPYRPELGAVGPLEMAGRVWENLRLYLEVRIPGGLTGVEGGGALALGLLVVGLALVGWGLAIRRRIGAAELFTPLYLGMILVWPQVWASERFVLPLLPVFLLYAGGAVMDAVAGVERRVVERGDPDVGSRVDRRVGQGGRGGGRWAGALTAAAATFLLLAPAGAAWWERAETVGFCREVTEQAGPFGCYGPPVQEYVAAALWGGAHLPEDAVVLTRKPRIFYVLSGVRAEVFPFSDRPEVFLDAVRTTGADHAVADRLDAQASRYLVPVVIARPGLFCVARSFGGDGGGATHLLGVLPDSLREERSTPSDAEGVSLRPCPTPSTEGTEGGGTAPRAVPDPRDPRIPMLRGGTDRP